jgi:hypothetical protein
MKNRLVIATICALPLGPRLAQRLTVPWGCQCDRVARRRRGRDAPRQRWLFRTLSRRWRPIRPNPKKLNPLQLRTLTLLQALARERAFADPPQPDRAVSIHPAAGTRRPLPRWSGGRVGARRHRPRQPQCPERARPQGSLARGAQWLACPHGRGARLQHGDRRRAPARRRPLKRARTSAGVGAQVAARRKGPRRPSAVVRTADPEPSPLLLPTRRQRPLQLLQHDALICAARENRFDEVGRQQRQPKDPADVAPRDVLGIAISLTEL